MCYVCGESRNKMVHKMNCRYAVMIPDKNRKYFATLREAGEAGYVQCKYCAYIRKYMKEERKELSDFCRKNGLYYEFNREDGALDVISRTGRWKIIVNGKRHFIWLYHKNLRGGRKDSFVPGYHSQKICRSTLIDYMKYIAEHDQYRMENPLYESQKAGRGKRARAEQRQQAQKVRKWQSIRYVTELLNIMSAETPVS